MVALTTTTRQGPMTYIMVDGMSRPPKNHNPKRAYHKKVKTGCKTCKIRRVRCDEGKPCCQRCVSTGRTCDGYALAESYPKPQTVSSPGFVFINFSLSSQPATTASDRLSSYLVTQLGNIPEIIFNLPYWKHLPARLNESRVLHDSLAVFCNSWTNYRRGLAPDDLIEPRLYGRALQSLQAALTGPDQLRTETLTAIIILQRIEVLFDVKRKCHVTVHSGGMMPLLQERGFSELEDPLDAYVTIEVQPSIITHCLVNKEDNSLMDSSWVERMQEASDRIAAESEEEGQHLISTCQIEAAMALWPELTRSIRDIFTTLDLDAARSRAAREQHRIAQLLDKVHADCMPLLEEWTNMGVISQKPDAASPTGLAYEFATVRAFGVMISYATASIIFTQMIYSLSIFQQLPTDIIQTKLRLQCSQMTMLIPYLQRQGPLVSMLFLTSFCLAHIGANDAEKKYLREYILEMDAYRGRFPRGEGKIGPYMDYVAKCGTGLQDFNFNMVAANFDPETNS